AVGGNRAGAGRIDNRVGHAHSAVDNIAHVGRILVVVVVAHNDGMVEVDFAAVVDGRGAVEQEVVAIFQTTAAGGQVFGHGAVGQEETAGGAVHHGAANRGLVVVDGDTAGHEDAVVENGAAQRQRHRCVGPRLVVADGHVGQADLTLVVDGAAAFGALGVVLEKLALFDLHEALDIEGAAAAGVVGVFVLA